MIALYLLHFLNIYLSLGESQTVHWGRI